MAEEDQRSASNRSTSPYHQKCFPPFCDNASYIDKQAIGKLDRDELEDKYIIYADENLALKRRMRDHERQIQRLQTAVARQDNVNKKAGVTPASVAHDQSRIDSLESQNKYLQSKVKVLKQQLLNHSYIHSKEHRINENKERSRRDRENSSPEPSFRDVGQTQSAREPKQKPMKDPLTARDNTSTLKERISELERMLEAQRNKYKSRIAQLEKQLASQSTKDEEKELTETTRKVSENMEMIRLQRLSQQLSEDLENMTDQYQAVDNELAKTKAALNQASERIEALEKQLEREREKALEAQNNLTKNLGHAETIRVLEEQIRDLENERKTLRETNEQLLQLTSGTQSRTNTVKTQDDKSTSSSHKKLLSDNEPLQKEFPTSAASSSHTNKAQENENLQQELLALRSQYEKENTELLEKLDAALKKIKELEGDKSLDAGSKKVVIVKNNSEELEQKLNEALAELENLRTIAAQHEQCRFTEVVHTVLSTSTDPATTITQTTVVTPAKTPSVQVTDTKKKRRWPDAKRVLALQNKSESDAFKQSPNLGKVSSQYDRTSESSDIEKTLEKNLDLDLAKKDDFGRLPPLTSSLNNVSKLLLSRRAVIKSKTALPSDLPVSPLQETSETETSAASVRSKGAKSVKSKSETSIHKTEEEIAESDTDIDEAEAVSLSPRVEVTDISQPENISTKSVTRTVESDHNVDPVKYSIEIRNLNYSDPQVVITGSEEDLNPQSDRKISNVWKKAIVKYQPKEDTLRVFFIEEGDEMLNAPSEKSVQKVPSKTTSKSTLKSQKSEVHSSKSLHSVQPEKSHHTISSKGTSPRNQTESADNVSESGYSSHEQVVTEPEQKPVLIIVSKHEFDAVLVKKRKYYSETEVALPVPQGEPEMVSCRMEICVYDLEVEDNLLDNLHQLERDPQVFVMWTFLGLEQRTVSMPAAQAHFHTNVAYFGPLTEDVAQQIDENEMVLRLMLDRKGDDGPLQIGAGRLLITPAIQKPGHGFLRCVELEGNQGSATVYCSFRLLECCKTSPQPPECLDVGIGHLHLKHCDLPSNVHAPHLYIEYSVLGHCGTELETESKPKGETVRFNHTKRVFVTDENRVHLEAMLEEDNPRNIRFVLMSEPCNLVGGTEVEEIGYAELNLVDEMLNKNQDVVSAQLPVFSNNKEELGSLSVTVIGINTLRQYAQGKDRAEGEE